MHRFKRNFRISYHMYYFFLHYTSISEGHGNNFSKEVGNVDKRLASAFPFFFLVPLLPFIQSVAAICLTDLVPNIMPLYLRTSKIVSTQWFWKGTQCKYIEGNSTTSQIVDVGFMFLQLWNNENERACLQTTISGCFYCNWTYLR